MECFIQGTITGAVLFYLGRLVGLRRGAEIGATAATEIMFERHPQLVYWEKAKRGSEN